MRKMIVSDFDETLYLNEEISLKDKQAILQFQKNNIFVVATGRTYYNFNAEKETLNPNYLICDHGSLIFKNEELIFNQPMEEDLKQSTIDFLKKHVSIEQIIPLKIKANVTNLNEKNINKIQVAAGNETLVEKLIQELNKKQFGLNYYRTTLFNKPALEIVSRNINKAKAIKVIADLEDVDRENIYTVGDSYNDVEMLKTYNGYAMESGNDVAKDVSVGIVDSVADLINKVSGDKNETFKHNYFN